MTRVPFIIPVAGVLLHGCSVVYDADDLRGSAHEGGFLLDAVQPDRVLEGEGSAATGRPIPIVLGGHDIPAAATVSIRRAPGCGASGADAAAQPAAVALAESPLEVSGDRTVAAFSLSVPVDPALASGDSARIFLTVSDGTRCQEVELEVIGLDELELAGGTLATDVDELAPVYSTVQFTGPVLLEGAAPARFVATAEIVIDAAIAADCDDSGAPGAGGCAGGPPSVRGGCGAGGGGPGPSGVLQVGPGGGGGGHAGPGDKGAGDTPENAGGAATGDETLVPPRGGDPAAGARGHGGGGGGGGLLSGTGGHGGGGGGVIELTSGGVVRITEAGSIRAAGGDGADATGGGGGGGSGGGVLIRAAAELDAAGVTPRVSAPGGAGGEGDSRGGDGADGRVRIDSPGGDPSYLVTDAARWRGPMIAPSLPPVVRTSPVEVTVSGVPGGRYGLMLHRGEVLEVLIGPSGEGTIAAPLEPGRNVICALVTPDAEVSVREAASCRAVALVP
ncbi:MAG TPA: hypothetical protein VKZ63_03115 [Kofleriaceae bacterium]|nr:hypothetical protein [Kofleriaceae bacterium]